MRRFRKILSFATATMCLLTACSGDKTPANPNAAEFLPAEYSAIGVKRCSEIRTFAGRSLWEYINGGAELYHHYDFIEVATADYKKGAVEIVVDVYRFSTSLQAFGIYSMLRPDDVNIIRLGTEGFQSPACIEFVKGPYLVKFVGFDDTNETNHALINLAYALNKLLPPAAPHIAEFSVFPESGRIPATDKYWAESFLGQKFLTNVFSREYLLDTTRMMLFLADNQADTIVRHWSELAGQLDKFESSPEGIPFDDGTAFVTEDFFYGRIAVGMKNGKLVGMVGYREEYREFLSRWLLSLK